MTYRNPVIYARELRDEMVRDDLTRNQLAERYGISSDRITQWLCLLKLPKEKLKEIKELGDNWERQLVTERTLRRERSMSRVCYKGDHSTSEKRNAEDDPNAGRLT